MFQLLTPEASGNGCSSQRSKTHEEHEVGYISYALVQALQMEARFLMPCCCLSLLQHGRELQSNISEVVSSHSYDR